MYPSAFEQERHAAFAVRGVYDFDETFLVITEPVPTNVKAIKMDAIFFVTFFISYYLYNNIFIRLFLVS